LVQWNVYGLDNIGKINSNDSKYYYLKDHLGSIRAMVNSNNELVSAQDYDPWGYLLSGRTYQGSDLKFKFTEKERDVESGYDYFGARYYDARIAIWTSIDPLMEKHYDYSPYNYVLRNPLRLVDPDGQQVEIIQNALNIYNWYRNDRIQSAYYNSLSLVGKEQYTRDQPGYNSGRVEATGDELLLVPFIAKGITTISKVGKTSLSLESANIVTEGISLGVETRTLSSTKLNLGTHVQERMVERSITEDMIKIALRKGERFWDPKNKSVNFILEKGFASSKSLLVGQNPITGKITTVYPGMDLIKKRFIQF